MEKTFKRILIIVFSLLIMAMAVGTFVEQRVGNGRALQMVYHSWWFITLWTVLAAGGMWALWHARLWRRAGILLLHASFLLILGGALITFLTGREGTLHLREGSRASWFYLEKDSQPLPLPIELRLDSFRVRHYDGTTMPADFISYIHYYNKGERLGRPTEISMNHIFKAHGYRFYQTSYDPDEGGTVLTVKHDPWGIGVTYAGYLLFALSMLWLLLSRRGEFVRLLRHPLLRRGGLLVWMLVWAHAAMGREAVPTLPRPQADSMAWRQVMYNGRVVPFNTLAIDFVTKIYGRPSYRGLSAEQVLLGWSLRPDAWKDQPMLKVKQASLRHKLGLREKYATFAQLFSPGQHYKLEDVLTEEGLDGPMSKAVRELDEKVGLILMATEGTLIQPRPKGVPSLSRQRIGAEILYNKIPFCKWLFMANLTLGLLLFFLMAGGALRRHDWLRRGASLLLWLALIFHAAGYLLRWYIGGRIPLGNGYETMLFMALMLLLLTALLHRRLPLVLPFGLLLSGFTLLVAWLGQMNPQITPLMPVLNSPLLSLHVSVIMAAYALLAFMMMSALWALVLIGRGRKSPQLEQLTLLSRLMLWPAVFLLGVGIFLGALWANISWGSYWSWDPKEVWALITFMVYGSLFHRHALPSLQRPAIWHACLVAAFLLVLMTYFGVNYFLGGMHSYA